MAGDRLFFLDSDEEGKFMTSLVLRLIGILFLVAAVVVAILNLHRVANLGMPWLAPPLMLIGAAFVIGSRRGRK